MLKTSGNPRDRALLLFSVISDHLVLFLSGQISKLLLFCVPVMYLEASRHIELREHKQGRTTIKTMLRGWIPCYMFLPQ